MSSTVVFVGELLFHAKSSYPVYQRDGVILTADTDNNDTDDG